MLIGTDIGMVYNFNLKNFKLIEKYNQVEKNSRILSIKYYDNYYVTLNSNSKIQIKNFYDDFDQKIEFINKENETPSDMEMIENNCFIGMKNGNILTKNINENNNIKNYHSFKCEILNKINWVDSSKLIFLFKGSNSTIYDIEKKKVSWIAKNMKEDELRLQKFIFDLNSYCINNELFITDKFSFLRFFDIRSNRRKSLMDLDLSKYEKSPINNIIVNDNLIYLSNLNGSIFILDKKKDCSIVKKISDSFGSITDLKFSNNKKEIVSIGLDRYIRSYDSQDFNWINEEFLNIKLRTLCSLENFNQEEKELEEEDLSLNNKKLRIADINHSLDHNLIKLKYEKKKFN